MSKEYSNQKIREDSCEVSAWVKLDPVDIDSQCRQFNGCKFVPLDDFHVLLSNAARQLMTHGQHQSPYIECGIEFDMVRQVLCALLRVPAPTTDTAATQDLKLQTHEEIKSNKAAQTMAARISKDFFREGATTPTYEAFFDRIAAAPDSKLTQKILLAAVAKDVQMLADTSEPLPMVQPPPKTLNGEKGVRVQLKISCVDESKFIATVQIQKEDKPTESVLDGLLGKSLPMEFSSTKKEERDLLLGKQLVKRLINCQVTVVRALRKKDSKLTKLKLIEVVSIESQQKEVGVGLSQLALDFGSN